MEEEGGESFDHLVGDGKQRWRHHFDEKSR
jgi:hypothetical protein